MMVHKKGLRGPSEGWDDDTLTKVVTVTIVVIELFDPPNIV